MHKLTLFLTLFCCVFAIAEAATAKNKLAGSKPNIVLVMTDDQGYPAVGRHGHPWLKTPNLDKMYDNSVHLNRFLVAPTCAPTRSALMTGRTPMRNGITHTILERERMALDATILPQVLAKAGYVSGIFGKWHLGDEDAYQPHSRGFNEVFVHGAGGIGQAYPGTCADVPGNKYFDPVVRHNKKFVKTKGFCTDIFFTAAECWINKVRKGDQPFFAYITTNAPHGPFIAPPKNAKRFTDLGFVANTAGFYGMIENIDENVGELFDKLEKWNLLDNTLVIFLSDNGMTGGGSNARAKRKKGEPKASKSTPIALGTDANGKPMMFYNAEMKGMKGSADEGGVRVPAFFLWKGKLAKDKDVDLPVAHIDLLPTLAELAGVGVPKGQVEGRSFLTLLENPAATAKDWPDRNLITACGRWPKDANVEDYKYKRGFAVRNHRFRLVGTDALYDMLADPSQTKNVIEEHPEVAKAMLAAYDKWWKGTVPLMVNENETLEKEKPYHVEYKKQLEKEGIPIWDPKK